MAEENMGNSDLRVDLGLYEGPLDLLLEFAREQKVDLRQISILRLAEQYIAYISEMRRLHLNIAVEYLVMAAWLAYLKSRLLLPATEDKDNLDAEEIAELLRFRLQRLEALRRAGENLFARASLGLYRFPRGAPEDKKVEVVQCWQASILELARAYSHISARDSYVTLQTERRQSLSIEDAIENMRRILDDKEEWLDLEQCLPEIWRQATRRRSGFASGLAASLELVRNGTASVRQEAPFANIYLRKREIEQEEAVS